jgi:hypothetical protein
MGHKGKPRIFRGARSPWWERGAAWLAIWSTPPRAIIFGLHGGLSAKRRRSQITPGPLFFSPQRQRTVVRKLWRRELEGRRLTRRLFWQMVGRASVKFRQSVRGTRWCCGAARRGYRTGLCKTPTGLRASPCRISDIENWRSRDSSEKICFSAANSAFSAPKTLQLASNPRDCRHFSKRRKSAGIAPGGWLHLAALRKSGFLRPGE